MEAAQIPDYRLLNQKILLPTASKPEEIVSYLGAVQAQDYKAALWAIGLRCKDATQKQVEDAIARKNIVRTWPLRHTLHFVSPLDVKWMLSFYREEPIPKYQRNNGLTDSVLEKGMEIIANAFDKKEILTYPELHKAMDGSGITALDKNEVQSHIIRRAGREGLVCFGPCSEKKPTFTLLDKWVIGHKPIRREEALAELALRYFTSHGPATLQDYAWWSGLGIGDAKLGIEANSSNFSSESIGNKTYYMAKKKRRVQSSDEAYLLPAFDEYLISYKDRSAMLSHKETQKVLTSGMYQFVYSNGIFLPIVVLGGQVLGTWKGIRQKDKTAVGILPFAKFTPEQKRMVSDAAQNYGAFLEQQVEVKYLR